MLFYTGFQFGSYFRLDRKTGKQTYIQPKHHLGEKPYRFNWQTPILLSPHNQDILYMGGNKLMRSLNQGTDWTAISPDLTQGTKKGNVAYGTLTTISESPLQFGLIYTGSDDGLIQLTKDGGSSWSVISDNLPKDLWVTRVIASQHKKERVYATLNGYRYDDFKPYVYKSDDYGKTWTAIDKDLPLSPVNVIREDPKNANMLYLGTDNAAYVTMDGGNNWEVFDQGLPEVAVHDIAIQAEESDIVLATHGRSIYIADLEPLETLAADKTQDLQVFKVEDQRFSDRWGSKRGSWGNMYQPSVKLVFFAPKAGDATIKILSKDQKTLKSWEVKADKGLNYVNYDLSLSENGKSILEKADKKTKIKKADDGVNYLPVGHYTIEIDAGGQSKTTTLKIEEGRQRENAVPSAEELEED